MKRKASFILGLTGVVLSGLSAILILGFFSEEGALTTIVALVALGGTLLLGLNKKRKLSGALLLTAAVMDFIILGNILTSALYAVAGVLVFIKK